MVDGQSVDTGATIVQKPIVSVIASVFNAEAFIESAISSVVTQTFQDWELLVVDGGSSDGTRQIVLEQIKKDPRIHLIDNIDDQGPAHARSVGVRASKGDYIAFLDGDDAWLPSKLEKQFEMIQKEDLDIVCSGYRVMTHDGSLASQKVPIHRSYHFLKALCTRGITTSSVFAKRSCFTDEILDTYGRFHGEDYLWWLKILQKGGVAGAIKEPLMLYRDTPASLSKFRVNHQVSVWEIYRQELKIPLLPSSLAYVFYLSDVVLRRTYTKIATIIFGQVKTGLISNE